MMIRFTLILFCLQILTVRANVDENLLVSINHDEAVSFEQYFYTVLPGKSIDIGVESGKSQNIVIECDIGKITKKDKNNWKYLAPNIPGNYILNIEELISGKSCRLVVFVLTPAFNQEGEYLNNYRIGNYPVEKYKGKKRYTKPDGFIEVTKENKDLFITPHFKLSQFLCKQNSGWPKYVILNPVLLVKLEYLVEELHSVDPEINTLTIMSGYRTPYYNKLIGNVKYSRHIYGDAADVYVDENRDDLIDDLDNNGRIEMQDVMVMHRILSELEKDPENEHLVGGIGSYNKNSAHTYFIHVDTRGYRARW
jgi:peptidase M15-like protein